VASVWTGNSCLLERAILPLRLHLRSGLRQRGGPEGRCFDGSLRLRSEQARSRRCLKILAPWKWAWLDLWCGEEREFCSSASLRTRLRLRFGPFECAQCSVEAGVARGVYGWVETRPCLGICGFPRNGLGRNFGAVCWVFAGN